MPSAIYSTPVRFDALEGWVGDDHAAAFRAFSKSCRLAGYDDALRAHVQALGAQVEADTARAFFESHFEPRAAPPSAPGFVTGYYEPELRGSRTKSARFPVPVLGRPDDLATTIGESDRAWFNDRITGFRAVPDGTVPYYTRAEIEDGALDGNGLELVFVEDAVDLFFMQVQGSGLVRLDDGRTVRLTYAGKNGHPYTSIARVLVERHGFSPGDIDMDALKTWLRADPARGRALMRENASYVFFKALGGGAARGGPWGAEGIPLTPGRSLAVDPAYIPLGSAVFVAVPLLRGTDGRPFHRLMIAQDVGSAIGGPQRGDIFFGTGREAGQIAGRTRHQARFFVLVPKR